MTDASPLGEFEQVVLLAILRLGDEAYAVAVQNEILRCTGPVSYTHLTLPTILRV